ncbi:hypothetical protein EDD21DRAFT_363678 [Dissophora ornata]|nr:hypothetical protein EDD21DRAFT_363678 [Dissophora ornata]
MSRFINARLCGAVIFLLMSITHTPAGQGYFRMATQKRVVRCGHQGASLIEWRRARNASREYSRTSLRLMAFGGRGERPQRNLISRWQGDEMKAGQI